MTFDPNVLLCSKTHRGHEKTCSQANWFSTSSTYTSLARPGVMVKWSPPKLGPPGLILLVRWVWGNAPPGNF